MDSAKPDPHVEDSWKLLPEAVDEIRGPSQEEMHRAAARAWSKPILPGYYLSNRNQIRFWGKYGWVLWWKSLGLTIPCFSIGIGLAIAQFWLPEIDASLGNPLGQYCGLARLGLILLAGGLFIYAGPMFKPDDWTPAKQREEDRAHDYFRRKRGL
jgi:hypothetical protein